MRGAPPGPRVLLRRLRDLMAEPGGAQERLDRIVVLIAANMVAEVCSVYLMRSHGELELFATEGLNPDAVHKSRLRVGKGLVGLIAATAEPLSLSDAQSHPSFAYLPETGEEIYQSFLGVPVLREGITIGVIVVQNRVQRAYSEEELEALQTIAMVLAEFVASGALDVDAAPDADIRHERAHHLKGMPLSDGVALGHAVLHEPRTEVTNLFAADPAIEIQRLDDALKQVRASVDSLIEKGDVAWAGEHREVLESYRMFAHDRGWVRRMQEAVQTGLTAEAAVERVHNDYRARFSRQATPFLRERLHDLDDLVNRLLRTLTGAAPPGQQEMPENAILVARSMGAAELLDYERSQIRGLVLEEGGATSHVAIVAKALGLASVGQLERTRDLVDTGDAIIVDGATGDVHIRPSPDVERAFADKVRFRAKRQAQYAKLRDLPAVTRDGLPISLMVNAGLLVELPTVMASGAEGIGLFRTELQFMVASTFPRMREQTELYGKVMKTVGDMPVTFRTLDIGGDKVLPYLKSAHEENPALGWRAIRLSLDRPGLLRTQIRALLHAAAGRDLSVMFPMITNAAEFEKAKGVIEREKRHLTRHGYALPREIAVGAMLEVPSILWDLDPLLESADFLSVGSNDLAQYLFACDRGNARVAERYDILAPANLRALGAIVRRAVGRNVPVTLCGDMASRPLEAMALIGLGYESISLASSAIGPVKDMLRSLDAANLRAHMPDILNRGDETLRGALRAYADAHAIPV